MKFVGIDEDIDEVLNVEFTTLSGSKLYLDFLCLLKNGNLCHIEFQYPKAENEHYGRFFNYNILAQARHQKLTETLLFNFTPKTGVEKPQKIGETKCFNPYQFFLGGIDFESYIENINIKVESNTQLSHDEEIVLLLISLNPKFKGKCKILKRISELLENRKLFDETKFEFFQAIIELEIENLLSKEEQKEIKEEIKMTPKAMAVVTQAIHEVNQKVLAEAREDAFAEGKSEGMSEGLAIGRSEATERMAKALRDIVDINVLSEVSGLTVEEIENL